jgi:hypothetical protein
MLKFRATNVRHCGWREARRRVKDSLAQVRSAARSTPNSGVIINDMNQAEQRFASYLDGNDYSWTFEPDYQAEFGLVERPKTNPDFLVSRGGERGVCEVRQFESTRIRDALETAGGRSFLGGPKTAYGALRSAIWEKAEQLRPLRGLGVPLIIVLANPLQADVMLDDRHVPAAMFGNPKFGFTTDPRRGGLAEGTEMRLTLEDYGVFRSPIWHGEELVGWENRHPHVSAVAVVHERLNSADWRDEIMRSIPVADRTLEAAGKAAVIALRTVKERVAAGEEPTGTYRWVDLYDVDGDQAVAVPVRWFDGIRDRRFGFHDGGGYGPSSAS